MNNNKEAMQTAVEFLMLQVGQANQKWWQDLRTKQPIERNVGELLMLCVSELSEAMEGHRKSLQDDKLTHRAMFDVELCDCMIRILDIMSHMCPEAGAIFCEKMAFNSVRVDHTHEHRLSQGGKKY